MARHGKVGGKVPAAMLDALRERIRAFMEKKHCSWADLAEAAGYGRDNPGQMISFTRGKSGMLSKRYHSTIAALDSWPEWAGQGAKLHGARIFERDAVPSAAAAESLAEKARREAMERTEQMRARTLPGGIPHPSNRDAWEAYWLAQEKPALDGKKHRATPLSRQVA